MKQLQLSVALAIGDLLFRVISLSIRTSTVSIVGNKPSDENCLWIGWHEFNLISLPIFRLAFPNKKLSCIVPTSTFSGCVMMGFLMKLNINIIPIRYSHERKALREVLTALSNNEDVAIALDGPSGPRRVAKPGVFWIIDRSISAIRSVSIKTQCYIRLPKWDAPVIPMPFSKIEVKFSNNLRANLFWPLKSTKLGNVIGCQSR